MATTVEFTKALLPEICDIKTGKHDANHATDNGKYRFYTCSSQYSMCDTYSFDGKAVIVPGNGDIGLVFYYDGLFEAYQRTYVLTNIKILPKYLYYHMLLYWRSFNERKKFGSTVKYVRMSNFSNYEITYPPIAEQERIVAKIEELFSQSDKAIQTLQTVKQQLSIYRQSVLKSAFEGDYSSTQLKNVIINLQNGIAKRKGTEGKNVIVLRLANISDNSILYESEMRKILLTDTEQIRYMLSAGDALIVRVNGSVDRVGRMVLIDKSNTYAYCDHLIRCVFDKSKVLPQYIKYYFDKYESRQYIKNNIVSTAGQNTVSQTTLENLQIKIPPIETQQQIVSEIESRLSVCDSIEKTVDDALLQAEALRQSILKQAFTPSS